MSTELLDQWLELTQQWQPAFAQARTHQRAQGLGIGLLCGLGQRTITRALGFLGQEQQDWTADYKFFSRSHWQPYQLFDDLMHRGLEHYCPQGLIPVALDDTVLPRCGKAIPNASWHRDAMGPPFQVNLIWGQRFMQASLLLPLYQQEPLSSPRALPVRFAECPVIKKPGKKATSKQRKDYKAAKKKHNLSTHFVEVVQQLRQRLDDHGNAQRTLLALGDGSYCNRTTFTAEFARTSLLCRARKNLRLCFPSKEKGRIYSKASFTPQEIFANKRRRWKRAWIFHGGKWRLVRYKEVKKILWQGGARRKELRLFVLAPTPYLKTKSGRKYYRQKAFLLTDDLESGAPELLQHYFDRFEIEVNHRDEKSVLGVGQAQVWAEASVPRVPEFMVAAYSALLLAGLKAYGPGRTNDYVPLPKWRRRARRASCLDLVTLLRRQIDEAAQRGALPEALGRRPRFAQMILRAAA